jgi:hypothetical protein
VNPSDADIEDELSDQFDELKPPDIFRLRYQQASMMIKMSSEQLRLASVKPCRYPPDHILHGL